MQKRLVLWDVDHTLVDAGGLSGHCYGLVFRQRFGRELENPAPMHGRTDRAIVADTLRRNGIDDSDDQVEAFRAALEAILDESAAFVRAHGRALPGAAQALAALADRPVVQSLLTGNVRPYAEAKVRPFALHTFLDLDSGAYGWEHPIRSELVRVARAAAGRRHRADFSGLATVLVGDTPLDIEAALTAGASVVAVATGAYSVEALWEAGAHAVLPDLGDTDHVVETILKVSA